MKKESDVTSTWVIPHAQGIILEQNYLFGLFVFVFVREFVRIMRSLDWPGVETSGLLEEFCLVLFIGMDVFFFFFFFLKFYFDFEIGPQESLHWSKRLKKKNHFIQVHGPWVPAPSRAETHHASRRQTKLSAHIFTESTAVLSVRFVGADTENETTHHFHHIHFRWSVVRTARCGACVYMYSCVCLHVHVQCDVYTTKNLPHRMHAVESCLRLIVDSHICSLVLCSSWCRNPGSILSTIWQRSSIDEAGVAVLIGNLTARPRWNTSLRGLVERTPDFLQPSQQSLWYCWVSFEESFCARYN